MNDIIESRPDISITYFIEDMKKAGGSYQTVSGRLKRIDEYKRALVMEGGTAVPFDNIADIDGDVFGRFEF